MKCSFCNGLGYIFVDDFSGQFDEVCPKCKGKKVVDDDGKPILTNEEWFCQLSTEKKAEFFCKVYELGKKTRSYMLQDKVVEFLKEEHK